MMSTNQLSDFADVAERGAHDNSRVAVLLVVVVDAGHALHT